MLRLRYTNPADHFHTFRNPGDTDARPYCNACALPYPNGISTFHARTHGNARTLSDAYADAHTRAVGAGPLHSSRQGPVRPCPAPGIEVRCAHS